MMVKIRKVFWKETFSGKAMVLVEVVGSDRQITCCFEPFPDYQAGITVEFDDYTEMHHKKWGDYLLVKKFTLVFSTIQSGVEFLSVGLGLPQKDAEKITKMCNGDLYRHLVLEDGVSFLTKMGMKEQPAHIIVDRVRQMVVQKELLDFLAPYGGNYTVMKKVVKEYGPDGLRLIKENPYLMSDYGWTITQCDSIAKDLGIQAVSDMRLDAIVMTILKAEKMAGHTYALAENITAYQDKVRNDVFPDKITGTMLIAHTKQEDVVKSNGMYYLRYLCYAEKNTARQILRLQSHAQPLDFDDTVINDIEEECGIKYAPQQRDAFSLLKQTGIAILTGGPGTGKSATRSNVK